ncbi:MAG: thioredoxin family protein [Flavobacteriaceae bacterium]|nr:thioredoxin family protein [Flavobacteriaceae bacterium]
MKELLKKSVEAAMSYSEYILLCRQLVAEGRTTGEPTAERINFTKLNLSRTKRLDKLSFIPQPKQQLFQKDCAPCFWLAISEPWCGDAAQTLPYLNKLAQLSNSIQLAVVLRDEHPELMDAFLTDGSRGIPKLIILDEDYEVLGTWGPRSKNATQLVVDYKAEYGMIDARFKENLQVWYNQDKGMSIIEDISDLMRAVCNSETIV